MNIYDCFMYYDEDLLLDLRLNTLNEYVKKFVISEATYTHNGDKKKLKFDFSNFQKFKDKVIDRTRKIIPNELADVAVKAAPFVAPFNPGIAGLMRGIGRLDQRGNLILLEKYS